MRMMLTILICALVVLVISAGCFDPKERLNPLDPDNPETGGDPFGLTLTQQDVVVDTETVYENLLEWRDIDHHRLDEYHIFRRQANNFFALYELQAVHEPGDTIYRDRAIDPNQRYFYQVTALFFEGVDSVTSESVESTKFPQ